MDDFKWFTYWIRHAPEQDHMEVTLRAAIKVAKDTNQKSKYDKLMYMGSQWKMQPNMSTWHDALEQESSEHTCYRLSITPDDYEPNGYVYLDMDTRARMAVFLYYGHKEEDSPEERNEYKRIYCKWHPQSHSFRNLDHQEYRNIRVQSDDSDDEVKLAAINIIRLRRRN